MRGDSPWLVQHRRQERAVRHARFRNSIKAGVLRAFFGALAVGTLVMLLQRLGVFAIALIVALALIIIPLLAA